MPAPAKADGPLYPDGAVTCDGAAGVRMLILDVPLRDLIGD